MDQTRFEKYLNWCKTKSGRTICHRTMVVVNIGVFSALYFPHSFLLKKYQSLTELYENGKPVPVPENIMSLYNEVLEDLNIQKLERSVIKPFMVFGFDVFEAGMGGTKTGGIIGIPKNFTFKTPQDADATRILMNAVPVNLSLRETEDLVESLVLSRDAQKFAIAREIRSMENSGRLMDSFMGIATFIACNTFCHWIKDKYDMYNKSLRSRVFLYVATGLTGFGFYFAQKDFFKRMVEKSVDEELTELGPNYVKGGHEFYSKMLKRNIAHRKLLDKHGKELFDEDGNNASFIRQKSIPITKRKSFFETKIDEFVKEQQSTLNSDLEAIAADVESAQIY